MPHRECNGPGGDGQIITHDLMRTRNNTYEKFPLWFANDTTSAVTALQRALEYSVGMEAQVRGGRVGVCMDDIAPPPPPPPTPTHTHTTSNTVRRPCCLGSKVRSL